MVELKISIERDSAIREKAMDCILSVHHYEEPVIFVREAWASRANYNPKNDNPHRGGIMDGGCRSRPTDPLYRLAVRRKCSGGKSRLKISTAAS